MMPREKQPRIALVWSQFAACHVDRCVALARRLDGVARVVAVEVASTSRDYAAFPPSGETEGAHKRTLFPGRSFDEVPRWRRFMATLGAVKGCRMVCIGVPYSELEFVLLAWLLRLLGKQVVLLCDSKFDDFPRSSSFEVAKQLALLGYSGAIVASARSKNYLKFLGFRRRALLPGSDGVSLARIREEAKLAGSVEPEFAARDFVFAGRFVAVKNLPLLIDAYARYRELAGGQARRLRLAGAGPLEAELRQKVAALGLEDRVIFAGFLTGPALAGLLGASLALILTSYRETWGLVVTEALALGVPVITTQAPGSRDLLVRNLVNGFVLENGAVEGLARAMLRLSGDQAQWERMRAASLALAPRGDVAVFCDAVERLLGQTIAPGPVREGLAA